LFINDNVIIVYLNVYVLFPFENKVFVHMDRRGLFNFSCWELPTLPTTRLRCNLDVWALAQSRGDGHCSLV